MSGFGSPTYATGYGHTKLITIRKDRVRGGVDLAHYDFLVIGTYPELRTTGNGGRSSTPTGSTFASSTVAAGLSSTQGLEWDHRLHCRQCSSDDPVGGERHDHLHAVRQRQGHQRRGGAGAAWAHTLAVIHTLTGATTPATA